MNQPDDLPPATGIEAKVCADIAARQRLGIAKYGVTVEQSPDDMLQHAYEEALDLAVYLKAEIDRKRDLERKLGEAMTALLKIEERFTDGEDTYDDWRFMGTVAREALARIDSTDIPA